MYQNSKILGVMIASVRWSRQIDRGWQGVGFRGRQPAGYNNAQFTPPDAQVHETVTFLLVSLPNIHQLYFFIDRLSNKPFLIWLLTTAPYLKYVATLLCNLSLIACFVTIMFHKEVWQHMQGLVGFLITTLLQIDQGIFQ